MKEQLDAEAEDDQEVYDKIMCWCKTNRNEKKQSITVAEKKIEGLEAELKEDSAKMEQMKEQIL